MKLERIAKCERLTCDRMVLYSPGDRDGLCAVCSRTAFDAMRASWLQAMGERDAARADLDAMTTERDDLALELERERMASDERAQANPLVGRVVL